MKDLYHPLNWKYQSSEEEGFHEVVTPENSACKIIWVFRLNLKKGHQYRLKNDILELNGAVINGAVKIDYASKENELEKFDSFYLPAKEEITISAKEDVSIFIGGSLYEGIGKFFVRKYDLSLPLGDIHQVHGKPPYERDVFMTIAQQDEGSRLICGITYGEPGAWTSISFHKYIDI